VEGPLSAGGFYVKAAKEEKNGCLDADRYGNKAMRY
jgi:hypothetical protein